MESNDNMVEEAEKRIRCNTRRQTGTRRHDARKSNRVMSYIIPPIVVMIAIFSTYVWFDMCIQWYLRNGRKTTGGCLLAFQILLLLLMGASFLQITLTDAGYLPNAADRARLASIEQEESRHASAMTYSPFDANIDEQPKTYDRKPSKKATKKFLEVPRLDSLDVYIARPDTSDAPRWCSVCQVDKYDRVHHCSEVNRCIKKFDHFCPWVGGPIGHTRYKFFFQFITYVAIYCVYIVITIAVAVVDRRHATQNPGNILHIPANPGLWYACIALGSLFGIMMVPFSLFHGRQIALNKTTIEYVETRGAQIIVTVPSVDEDGRSIVSKQRIDVDPDTHPFDLGLWQNWQQILGPIIMDKYLVLRLVNWILPIQGSPGNGLIFPYNPVLLDKLRRNAEMQARNEFGQQ